MRKTVAMLAAGCLVCLPVFTASGQEEKADKPEAKADRKASKEEKRDKKPRPLHGTGSVVKVQGSDVLVRLRSKGTLTMAIDGGTLFLKGRDAAKLEDLKTGQRVRVIYESNETGNVAREIHLIPALLEPKGRGKSKERKEEGKVGGDEPEKVKSGNP